MNFRIELAEIPIEIFCSYDFTFRRCKGFFTDKTPSFSVSVCHDDINAEKKANNSEAAEEYLEFLAIFRKICEKIIEYDVVLLHSSCIEFEGKAYAFVAPSGTGKSTHSKLWQEKFGSLVSIINDDKPLIKITENGATVYGTPWNGKFSEGFNRNAPLSAFIKICRSEENSFEKLSETEALSVIGSQTFRPQSREKIIRWAELTVRLSKLIPMGKMNCNTSPEAAEVCHRGTEKISEERNI